MSERSEPSRLASNNAEPHAKVIGRAPLLVAAYAAAVFLPFLGSGRTLTSHEVMVAQPALEMIRDGSWIVPHYAGRLWLDKPPLVNWLTAIGFLLTGGFSEFAARLPAALSAVGLCALVAALARTFFGNLAGIFAGLIQATSVYMYIQGRLGEIDMPFALLITAAHAPLVLRWGRGHRDLPLRFAALFHTLAGLAVLAKGPVAVALFGATVCTYCIFRRAWWPLRSVLLSPAILCFVVIAGSWHVAALLVTGQEAIDQWRYNNLARFLGLHRLGASSPLFYFYTIPWMLLPWTIVPVLGCRRLWRAARASEAPLERLLWAWFLGGLVLLTLSAFKHLQYAIPILPPLSLLSGQLLAEHTLRKGALARRFFTAAFAVMLVAFGVIGAVVMPARDHRRPTIEFIHAASARVPADAPLHVLALGQSFVYPYIAHRCVYPDVRGVENPETTPEAIAEKARRQIEAAVRSLDREPMWVLIPRKYLSVAADWGIHVEEVLAEPERKKYPAPETLLLGIVQSTSSEPTSKPTR
jgi:4-amino-4-deoxy-L-arabinose transferase-like glycosyltransferase